MYPSNPAVSLPPPPPPQQAFTAFSYPGGGAIAEFS